MSVNERISNSKRERVGMREKGHEVRHKRGIKDNQKRNERYMESQKQEGARTLTEQQEEARTLTEQQEEARTLTEQQEEARTLTEHWIRKGTMGDKYEQGTGLGG